jgi:2,3-dihydroxybenzoate---[aryl-carrier protein] ligase
MLPEYVGWPEDYAERYRRSGLWRGETLGDLLRRWSGTDGQRTALVAKSSRFSYAELDERADRLASGLRRIGIGPGDRVVVQLPNVPELIVVCIALFRNGSLPVLALPAHRRSEISFLCRHCEAVALIIADIYRGFDHRTLAGEIRNGISCLRHILVAGEPGMYTALASLEDRPIVPESPSASPADVAFFLISGGPSALPKLIPRTHDDYAYQLRASAEALGVSEQSTYLAVLPIAHNAALGCPGVLGTLRAGGKVVLAESPSPDDVFPVIAREGVTFTTLVPTLFTYWAEVAAASRVDLSQLLIQVGGAHLDPEAGRHAMRSLGCRVTHWFGMAEGLLTHTRLDDPEEVVLCTQGLALSPADEVRVVDPSDRDVPLGAIGELLARGPYTIRSYFDAPNHNQVAFTPDGFLRTGDLVRITAEGNLVVEGRVKDVINRGGEKVAADEIEGHLRAHPGVQAVAVVATPDAFLGERTCACVVPKGGPLTLKVIREFLESQGLAHYKLPDRLELVESLPLTALGRVDKAVLRAALDRTSPVGRIVASGQ